MTRARIIHRDGTVEQTSDNDFYARVFGHPPKTKAEREAEYRADIERYIAMIEDGLEWAVPPPCLAECRRVIELREADEQIVDVEHLGPGRIAA